VAPSRAEPKTPIRIPATDPSTALRRALAACDQAAEGYEPDSLPGAKGEIKIDQCYKGRDHLVCSDIPTLEPAPDDHIAFGVNAVDLENRLCDVETDCRNRFHGPVLGIGSPHGDHDTYVPVEEPSTASQSDLGRSGRRVAGSARVTLFSFG